MAKNKNLIMHATGYAFVGDNNLFDVTESLFKIGLETIEAALKKSKHYIPTGQPMSAHLVAAGFNFNLLSDLTGGTVAAGSIRKVDEINTKVTNTVTLTETPESNDHLTIIPVGQNKEPLIKVAETPGVGEYTISTKAVTLNAGQTETTFRCIYFYADGSNGLSLTIDPDDVPDTFGLFLCVPVKDLFPDYDGNLIIDCAKAERISDIEIGGSKGAHKAFEMDVNIRNDNTGDVVLYYYAAAPA